MRVTVVAAALVALVCSWSGPGLAQSRARTPAEQAREQYERGIVAYNLERFDDAIAAFTRAYELDPAPTLLFNIAQSRWKKGENERALFYYRRYLEADPGAANRATVEARIRELEGARRAPVAAAPPPAPPAPAPVVTPAAAPPMFVRETAPPPPPPPLYRRPWFWGVVAATAAATVATVVLISSRSKAGGCAAPDCNLPMVTVP
jgi:tetratricopeptide (TPR) repeat protein